MKTTQNLSVRGFTLIEILIVVGIIGLLASVVLSGLGSVRGRGRDARRAADLRQVQQGLELYYTRCQVYPGSLNCGSGAPGTWADLKRALVGSGIGITSLPNDPLYSGGADDYKYFVSGDGQEYVLQATLEDATSPLLKESYGKPGDPAFNAANGTPNCTGKHYCIKF